MHRVRQIQGFYPKDVRSINNSFAMDCNGVYIEFMNKKILNIYGTSLIPSDYCERCKQESFIVDGRFNCCRKVYVSEEDYSRIMIHACGKKHRGPVSAKKKLALLKKQKGRCFYCGSMFGQFRIRNGKFESVNLEFDHVIPFSYGGEEWDLVACCGPCNRHKSDKMFDTVEDLKNYLRTIHEKESKA